MTREQIEPELRERLEEMLMPRESGLGHLFKVEVDALVSALAPWIMERIEEARCEERMDAGRRS